MSDDAATLARRFALALEHRRGRWDQQYVSARLLPAASTTPGRTAEPAALATVERSEARAEPPTSPPPVETRPTPPPGGASERPARAEPSAAARVETVAPAAQVQADASAPTPTDAVQEAPAVVAHREALRQQAQRWSPATKLEYLRRQNVGDCQRCPLARTRSNIVFGVGNPEADLMFVGEAPGADEDRQGEPFVGRAGQLLNRWLAELGLSRDDVYIANVLKCRPPGNRDPKPLEVDRCSPFLQAQIRAIEPKVIVALGRHAGMLLSRREDMTLRAMRGGRLFYDAGAPKEDPSARIQIPLVVTYHPAYVLRQEGDGREPVPGRPSPTDMVMTDLRRALTFVRGTSR
ncbi:uracil-DNA glycosylase [Paraliomyxa miuraensis]|uniref:uracil-DNA glycosylase n=1 Tax=Paraliomyxa miuraensis TaxID=376150 RepID=UPI00224E2A89|nr:uracil-DNA glycosylase family protein [Paraliomyxa miuraensis]MCX4244652.1 uracil-DNA glycosylase [Paraliomyxa miuraensis]